MHYEAMVVLERMIVCLFGCVSLFGCVVHVAMCECVQSDYEVPSFT